MRRTVFLLLTLGIAAEVHGDQPESVRVTEQELWQAIDLERPDLSGLKAAVSAGDAEAAAAEAAGGYGPGTAGSGIGCRWSS